MHPQLLMTVISEQAGTLSKAILEGVMNSVDAHATRCDIVCDERGVTISDDGQGLRSSEEIETFFENFGQPQTETKTFGTFRIGRGQLFKYGHNTWRTGTFEMVVDFKNDGLDYDLHEDLPPAAGCQITIRLYDKLVASELENVRAEVEAFVRYMPIPITWNGTQVSRDPQQERWTIENDQAYIRLRATGTLDVYNLGAYVRSYSSDWFGTAGVIISKQKLKLNFPRNDVQSTCPVWRRVQAVVRANTREKIERATTRPLSDPERAHACLLMKTGELPRDKAWSLKLITDIAGEHWSPQRLSNYLYRHRIKKIVTAGSGDLRADRLHQHKIAFVVARETLERFRVETLTEFLEILDAQTHLHCAAYAADFDELASRFSPEHHLVADDDLTERERVVLMYLAKYLHFATGRHQHNRQLKAGISETADAWTDGLTYIAFNRSAIQLTGSIAEWVDLGLLLFHELAHDSPSTATHQHAVEFYRSFHDSTRERLGRWVNHCVTGWPAFAKDQGAKLLKRALTAADTADYIERENAALAAAAAKADQAKERLRTARAAKTGGKSKKTSGGESRETAKGKPHSPRRNTPEPIDSPPATRKRTPPVAASAPSQLALGL